MADGEVILAAGAINSPHLLQLSGIGPGEINVAVSFDGMVVEPGDLVIGDNDGILCIPFGQVDAVLDAALAKQAAEATQMADILAGCSDRSWVDASLKPLGCTTVT